MTIWLHWQKLQIRVRDKRFSLSDQQGESWISCFPCAQERGSRRAPSQLIQRGSWPLQASIICEQVEMKRSPIRQEKGFTTLSNVGLEIRAAGFTVVDAEILLSVDRQNSEPVRIIL